MEMVRQQTLEGFYGNASGSHAPVTGILCSKIIEHTEKYCDLVIQENIPGALGLHDLLQRNVPPPPAPNVDIDIADEEEEADDRDEDGDA